MEANPILLFDGACGLCSRSVRFLLARDHGARLRFAPLDGHFGQAFRERHPALAGVDAVVWHDPVRGVTLTRSDAALAALRHLGGGWRVLAAFGAFVPRVLRDAGYDAVARRRHALVPPACPLPTATERARFLA